MSYVSRDIHIRDDFTTSVVLTLYSYMITVGMVRGFRSNIGRQSIL